MQMKTKYMILEIRLFGFGQVLKSFGNLFSRILYESCVLSCRQVLKKNQNSDAVFNDLVLRTQKCLRGPDEDLAGHICPAGRSLETPVLHSCSKSTMPSTRQNMR